MKILIKSYILNLLLTLGHLSLLPSPCLAAAVGQCEEFRKAICTPGAPIRLGFAIKKITKRDLKWYKAFITENIPPEQINCASPNKINLICAATLAGDIEKVSFLLEKGADPTLAIEPAIRKFTSPMEDREKCKATLQLLVDNLREDQLENPDPLICAIKSRKKEAIDIVLSRNIGVNSNQIWEHIDENAELRERIRAIREALNGNLLEKSDEEIFATLEEGKVNLLEINHEGKARIEQAVAAGRGRLAVRFCEKLLFSNQNLTYTTHSAQVESIIGGVIAAFNNNDIPLVHELVRIALRSNARPAFLEALYKRSLGHFPYDISFLIPLFYDVFKHSTDKLSGLELFSKYFSKKEFISHIWLRLREREKNLGIELLEKKGAHDLCLEIHEQFPSWSQRYYGTRKIRQIIKAEGEDLAALQLLTQEKDTAFFLDRIKALASSASYFSRFPNVFEFYIRNLGNLSQFEPQLGEAILLLTQNLPNNFHNASRKLNEALSILSTNGCVFKEPTIIGKIINAVVRTQQCNFMILMQLFDLEDPQVKKLFLLSTAKYAEDVALLQTILNLFPNLNETDDEGNTALHITASRDWVEGTRAIIEAGGEIDRLNYAEDPPIVVAMRKKAHDAAQILFEHGANLDRDGYGEFQIAMEYLRNFRVEYHRHMQEQLNLESTQKAKTGRKTNFRGINSKYFFSDRISGYFLRIKPTNILPAFEPSLQFVNLGSLKDYFDEETEYYEQKIECPNSYFSYLSKENLNLETLKFQRSISFVFAGRGDNAYVPRPDTNGRVILVVPRNQVDLRWLGANRDILVMENIGGETNNEILRLITARRLAAFIFGKWAGLRHAVHLDDNIETIVHGNGTISYDQLYDSLVQTAKTNRGVVGLANLANLNCMARPESYKESAISDSAGSKIFAFFFQDWSKDYNPFDILPGRLDLWGQDIYMQMALKKIQDLRPLRLSRRQIGFLRSSEEANSVKRWFEERDINPLKVWLEENPHSIISGHQNADFALQIIQQMKEHIVSAQESLLRKKKSLERIDLEKLQNRLAELNQQEEWQDCAPLEEKAEKAEKARPRKRSRYTIKQSSEPPPQLRLDLFSFSPSIQEISQNRCLQHNCADLILQILKNNEMVSRPLYPHQVDALSSYANNALRSENKSIGYFNIATGLGKSNIGILLAALWRIANNENAKNSVIVVPTVGLVSQFYEEFLNVLENFAPCIGEEITAKIKSKVITVSSKEGHINHDLALTTNNKCRKEGGFIFIMCMKSMSEHLRKNPRDLNLFDQYIVDEFHIPSTTSLLRVLVSDAVTSEKQLIGLSATPDDINSSLLDNHCFLEMNSAQGVDGEILAPWSVWKINKKQKELGELIENGEIFKLFAMNHPKGGKIGDYNTIVYLPNINYADQFYENLPRDLQEIAFRHHSYVPPRTRKNNLRAFNKSESDKRILIAVGMCKVGFDGRVDTIIVLKNISKLGDWTQLTGRSLRKLGEAEKKALAIGLEGGIPDGAKGYANRIETPLQEIDIDNTVTSPLEDHLENFTFTSFFAAQGSSLQTFLANMDVIRMGMEMGTRDYNSTFLQNLFAAISEVNQIEDAPKEAKNDEMVIEEEAFIGGDDMEQDQDQLQSLQEKMTTLMSFIESRSDEPMESFQSSRAFLRLVSLVLGVGVRIYEKDDSTNMVYERDMLGFRAIPPGNKDEDDEGDEDDDEVEALLFERVRNRNAEYYRPLLPQTP